MLKNFNNIDNNNAKRNNKRSSFNIYTDLIKI